ncbi:MAG: Glu/Leu/Phe/Val dehydrogenase [Gammaproteobacteria bacterium]|nr:Glu/Leu/Phe/Val dehydrogenase [Gammaproteobacteria bacterium]
MKSFTDKIVSDPHHPSFFPTFRQLGYGDLHIKYDESSDMLAIIAIHSTHLGPALGGCRFLSYPSLDAAILDAMRLAHGMSYKAAISNLPLGGGKAVVIRPPNLTDRTRIFRSLGHFINELGGRYITAEDSGTSVADMDIVRTVTPYVTGHSSQSFSFKDPAPITAFGVRRGIEAAIKHRFHQHSLAGIRVTIQGVGHVGYHLAKELSQQGAKLTICDINQEALQRCAEEFRAQIIAPEDVHKVECDVFSPCALGNVIHSKNIKEIRAPIIAGSANNQLEGPEMAQQLKDQGILYAPDYALNAGGLIYVAAQYSNQNEQSAKEKVENIYNTMLMIFECAQNENLPTLTIADRLAEQRLHHSA